MEKLLWKKLGGGGIPGLRAKLVVAVADLSRLPSLL